MIWYPATPTLSEDAAQASLIWVELTAVAARFAGGVGGWISVEVTAWSKRTQSVLPSLLLPGVIKPAVPTGAKGDPITELNLPTEGSYQRAITGPLNFDMLTTRVARVGQYATAAEPSGIHAVEQ